MFCMQYFIFLFLIPFPQASNFFLLSFLLCLFISHKPCLYCSSVIVGLLISSCQYYTGADDSDRRCWVTLDPRSFFVSGSGGRTSTDGYVGNLFM
ncbi:hypothetical protein BDZ88DRAFT_236698 [Geranomyces variabilis]|nr:hypothetical protein BDZ88DRAFT_236698 [Geranomyces variabilis]